MNLYQKKGEYDEMEYIAREALLEQLKAMESYNTSPMYRRGYDDCVEAILKAPAADVAPVVHGRWIEKTVPEGCRYFECSNCGAHENRHTAIKGYYCWRCGAKMDGGADNAESVQGLHLLPQRE